MSKVLIIGAGGVGRVVTYKCAQHPDVFSEILLASRTVSKCEVIAKDAMAATGHTKISTAAVDAENVPQLVELIRSFQPKLAYSCGLALSGSYNHGCLPGSRCALPGYSQL